MIFASPYLSLAQVEPGIYWDKLPWLGSHSLDTEAVKWRVFWVGLLTRWTLERVLPLLSTRPSPSVSMSSTAARNWFLPTSTGAWKGMPSLRRNPALPDPLNTSWWDPSREPSHGECEMRHCMASSHCICGNLLCNNRKGIQYLKYTPHNHFPFLLHYLSLWDFLLPEIISCNYLLVCLTVPLEYNLHKGRDFVLFTVEFPTS